MQCSLEAVKCQGYGGHLSVPPCNSRSLSLSCTRTLCSILFSDIVGFTVIGSHCTPSRVFEMLNELYSKFDDALSDFPDLYKVEVSARECWAAGSACFGVAGCFIA